MESPPPDARPRRRSRFRRWLVGGVLLLPVALFALSNATLATTWAKDKIASAISGRIGLETRLAGASWSPWNGVTLRGLEIRQPRELAATVREPLAQIGAIRITPDWGSFIAGSPKPLAIDLDSPRLVVPVQLIAFLASSQGTSTLPPLASHPADPPPSPPGGRPIPPASGPPPPSADPSSSGSPPAPALPLPSRPTAWIRVKNGSIAWIFAGTAGSLAELENIHAQIPIAGDSAGGSIRVGKTSLGGKLVQKDFKIPVRWEFPVISLPATETAMTSGVKTSLAVRIGRHGGVPFQIDTLLPLQPLPETRLPADALVQAESVGARLRATGLLLAPSTWQAEFLAESAAPTFHLSGERRTFDRGHLAIRLRRGILWCPDARLTSDEVSFLGNATLLADGRAAGVLRTVAAPETIQAGITRLLPGIRELPVFTPLSTPQRVALDLGASGSLGNLSFQLGHHGPVIGSNPAPK